MKQRTATHLVLATLAVLWLAAVVNSLRYRDLLWIQVFFVDITWLQVLLLVVGGYGALMMLAGALSRKRPTSCSSRPLPFVSVVVPAKNEEAVIEATVRNLCALDYADERGPQWEILIADDRSTDSTPRILERLASELPVQVIRTTAGSFGKAGAMNTGMRQARGELIVVFDADARVAPDYLRRMVACLDESRVGGVQSRRLAYNAGQNSVTRIQDAEYRLLAHPAQRGRQALGGMVSFSGNGMLFTRAALDDVGGVNEEALIENVDLTVRLYLADWEIRYCEDAVVWEEAIPNLPDLVRQRVRWFEGGIRCLGEFLPAILFGRAPVFIRLDMIFFLGGAVAAALALLTSYLFVLGDIAGMLVVYLQLPRRLTAAASGVFGASVVLAALGEQRWRPWATGQALARLIIYSGLPLVAVPLAIYRYVRSAITGEVSWEKTAHGASARAKAWSGHEDVS